MEINAVLSNFQARAAIALLLLLPLISGNAGAAPEVGAFDPTEILNVAAVNIQSPVVAASDDGSAAVVWRQQETGASYIFASRLVPGSGWTAATRISAYSASAPMTPHVVGGLDGSFLAAWGSTASSPTSFHYSWYHPGQGWSTPAPVSITPGQTLYDLALATDGLGNAFAVVFEGSGGSFNLSAVRYSVGSGWGSITLLETDAGDIEFESYEVAADESGNAVAVWNQVENTYKSVVANRYTPATGWIGVDHLEADLAVEHSSPDVSALGGGAFLAAWQGGRDIFSNTYTPASGWSGALALSAVIDGNSGWTHVGTVGNRAVVTWSYSNATAYEIRARVGAGDQWQPLDTLASQGNPNFPTLVASASAGTATATWLEGDGDVFVVRYVEGMGWSVPVLLYDHDTGLGLADLGAAMSPAGDAFYAWRQSAPNYIVTAMRIRESVAPSLSLTGPAEASVGRNASVWVTGATEPGAWVAANGVVAQVDAAGNFASLVPLSPGNNSITVVARDAGGNERSAWVNVTFDDPTAGLNGALSAAQADIIVLEESRAASEAALAQAQHDLSTVQANLTAAEAQLQASNARIDSLERRTPGGDSGTALLVGVLGVAVGLAALGVSLARGRGTKRAAPPLAEAPPSPKDPKA